GASTLSCAEHLWAVSTAPDRRRGRGLRIVETREMVGQLRAAHAHRFELPLLSRPVDFPPREVPMDPYALGLLLGDGCLTLATTPSFATADPELVFALGAALPGITPTRRSAIDYATLRALGLAGTRSGTKFIPKEYLFNTAEVRIALL